MTHYVAMIDILNLTLYSDIKVENVVFKPYSRIRDILEKIKKDKMPRVTAYAEVSFELTSSSREEAFAKAEEIITHYDWLWSFAQDRTVSHWGVSVYKIKNSKSIFLGTRWRPTLIIRPYGKHFISFQEWQLFLNTAIPVISSDNFIKKTNIIHSLHLYLDANKPTEFVQITFFKNWLALEILVNTYSNRKNIEFILTRGAFNRFQRQLKQFIKDHNQLNDTQKRYIIDNLPGLRRYPIKKRINDFLSAYNIEYDESEIDTIKRIRDNIAHSGKLPRDMDLHTVIEYERKLRVLLQRIYLTLLGCSFTYSVDSRGIMHPKLIQKEG